MRQPAGTYTAADLEALERAVENACCDYRDVLGPAEYPTYYKARTAEAKQQAVESDWQQLQAWLHRKERPAR